MKSWNYFHAVFYDEMVQVNGLVMVIDMTGFTLSDITKMNDPKIKEYEKDSIVSNREKKYE